jgi:nitroreductase
MSPNIGLDECIRGRRSVRAYKDKKVSRKNIETILEAGVWAPTAHNAQPWRFIVIEDKSIINLISDETKKAMRKALPSIAKRFETEKDVICYNAPVLILICTKTDPGNYMTLHDSLLAAQNMFLKAYALGLGTCYIGWIDYMNYKHPEILRKIVGVPEGYLVHVPLIVGYPKNKMGSGKRDKPNILKWIQ